MTTPIPLAIRRAYSLRSVTHAIPAPQSIDNWQADLADFLGEFGRPQFTPNEGLEWNVHPVLGAAQLVMWTVDDTGTRRISLMTTAYAPPETHDAITVKSSYPPSKEQRALFYRALVACLDVES